MLPYRRQFLCLLMVLFFCRTGFALVVDWDTATWTNGSLTGSVNGVDVAVTASTAGLFQTSTVTGAPPTPAVTRAFDGGLAVGEKTLEIAIDLPNNGNTNFVTVTLTFNAATYTSGAMNVSFKLFDIDSSGTYRDRIFNISATTVGGATLTPTVSNLGSAVTFSGGSLFGNASNTDTGATSGTGNAQIDFAASFIRSITFSYGSTNVATDTTYQHVGLHDITFTPVPEINPAWSAVFSCLAATGLVFHHRYIARRKK